VTARILSNAGNEVLQEYFDAKLAGVIVEFGEYLDGKIGGKVSEVQVGDIVKVTWLDACGEREDISECEIANVTPLVRHNYGEVLSIDDKGIRICYGDIMFPAERALSNVLFITSGMITQVDKIIPDPNWD